ncbi:MAG: hypothetical protein DWQ05_17955 [Calditrichaeota bacterium]|nr:MAG: hypothetical protein DWQ05_17955 [Calditrichota bacterium]
MIKDKIRSTNSVLPVCAFCKKIRDKNGRWRSVDRTKAKYAKMIISHGICEDCLEKHYPEYK